MKTIEKIKLPQASVQLTKVNNDEQFAIQIHIKGKLSRIWMCSLGATDDQAKMMFHGVVESITEDIHKVLRTYQK